jgi:hypothetical protein
MCSYISEEYTALKMEAVCSFEILVPTYQTTECRNPEDNNMKFSAVETSDIVTSIYIPSSGRDQGQYRLTITGESLQFAIR